MLPTMTYMTSMTPKPNYFAEAKKRKVLLQLTGQLYWT